MLRVNIIPDLIILGIICLCAAIQIFSPQTVYGKNHEITLSAGVEREIINYENGSDILIIRAGTSVLLGDSFIFNYTGLRNMDDGTWSYTWNIGVNGIGSFMNFTAGNYYLHFGSGLMMGRKTYSTGDPFSKKISISKDDIITPAAGAGPEYSLFGIAPCLYKTFDDIKISLIPFFSSQRRFISAESGESRAVDSSLFTLSSKIRETGNYSEPAYILNYGGILEIKALSLFTFQAYCFDTDLKNGCGEDITWDKNKFNYGAGIDLIRNCGVFAEYSDENISFFIEPAMSTVYCGEAVTGYAITWGMGIRNSAMNFSFRGKSTGTDFHSEYSSGGRNPERILEIKYSVSPLKWFEAGCAIYSEKDLAPAYRKDYLDGSIQEELFMSADSGFMHISLSLKRKEHYSTDRNDPIDKVNLSAGFAVTERFFLKLKSAMQRFENKNSGLAACEMKFMFIEYCSLSMGYTRITVHGSAPFYAAIAPASMHSPPERFSEPAHGVSIKFRYQKEKDSFYARLGMIRKESESETQAESAVVMVF